MAKKLTGASSLPKKPAWIDWFGTDGNDVFAGTNANDRIEGRAGADNLSGGNGDDVLYGDYINGAAVDPLTSGDVLNGGNGKDVLYGQYGDDRLYGGNGDDTLYGGDGNDLLDAGNDTGLLYGGAGDDTLLGGNGKDSMYGEEGDDTLVGGNGKDLLAGGLGADTLTGGLAADTFVFDSLDALDTVTDFRSRLDKLQLDLDVFTGLDPTSRGQLPSQYFVVDGAAAPTGHAYVAYDTVTGVLSYDTDGTLGATGPVEFAQLVGHPTISAADFYLA